MGVWNVTAQPLEINNRKSKVIAFVVNAGMNVTDQAVKYKFYGGNE